MFGIRIGNGNYLVEGTKSRGSAAGIGKIYSSDPRDALCFPSREEAQKTLEKEYDQDCDIDWHKPEIVELEAK